MQSEDVAIECPYCAETIHIGIDPSAGSPQEYIEDCQVCCRPIQILAELDEASLEWKIEGERSE